MNRPYPGCGGLRIERLGQAEIENLHRTVHGHLNVGRFQIAVNDTLFVRILQGFGDLPGDREGFVDL